MPMSELNHLSHPHTAQTISAHSLTNKPVKMSLGSSSATTRILCNAPSRAPYTRTPSWSHQPRTLPFAVSASPKKLSPSSKTGRFDSKNRRTGGSVVTTKEEEEVGDEVEEGTAEIDGDEIVDYGIVIPELPGDKDDFWEGPQWDAFGFFVQYMWAFGVVFALGACGVAVATYNEGATDFKDTPVYKESIQSQELLEGPDTSNSEVFESNPTEEAPALE